MTRALIWSHGLVYKILLPLNLTLQWLTPLLYQKDRTHLTLMLIGHNFPNRSLGDHHVMHCHIHLSLIISRQIEILCFQRQIRAQMGNYSLNLKSVYHRERLMIVTLRQPVKINIKIILCALLGFRTRSKFSYK